MSNPEREEKTQDRVDKAVNNERSRCLGIIERAQRIDREAFQETFPDGAVDNESQVAEKAHQISQLALAMIGKAIHSGVDNG